jgi:hypothetical protein
MRPEWFDYKGNCQVQDASQMGKSKFIESCCLEHLVAGNGFTVIDGKGSLYQNLFLTLARYRPQNPIVVLNLSKADFITPVDFFSPPEGGDVTAWVPDAKLSSATNHSVLRL